MSPALFLFAFLTISALHKPTNAVLVKIQTRNIPNFNDIALECTDDSDVLLPTMNIGVNRVIADGDTVITENFTDISVVSNGKVTFTITPSTEGNFSCVNLDDSMTSTNSIVVVAFPTTDPDFTLPQTLYTPLGSSATIQCSFEPGLLLQYYTINWYLANTLLNTANSLKYQPVSSNLSLIIYNTTQLDAGAYYCQLTVNNPYEDTLYTLDGLDVTLEVYGSTDLYPNTLTDTAVEAGISSVLYTCTMESAPVGSIRWLINGTSLTNTRYIIQEKQVNITEAVVIFTSNLTIMDPVPSDSGIVQCVGFADNGVETFIYSNEATLTVLGTNFIPVFQVASNDSLLLSIDFPGVILEVFTLHVRFSENDNTAVLVLNDPSFYNTNSIEQYTINRDTLPPNLNVVTAAVAVEVLSYTGTYLEAQSTIVLPVITMDTTQIRITATSTTTMSVTSTLGSSSVSIRSSSSSSSISSSSEANRSTMTTTKDLPSNTNVAGSCDDSGGSSGPLIGVIVVLVILLFIVLAALIGMCFYHYFDKRKQVKASLENRNENNVELHMSNPAYHTHNGNSTCTCTPECHNHSPTSDTNSYCSMEDHNKSRSAYTPSRPSSQESFYPDRSRTVSPLPHIYENDGETPRKSRNDSTEHKHNGPVTEDKNRTMSSVAVGTSPPRDGREIVIPAFIKGQSESPRKREDRFSGVMSPARSDPSLESSLKSEYSTRMKPLTQSIPVPNAKPMQTTYQRFRYGTNKPPVVATKEDEPKREDEKIYQKIIKEYDVV